MKSTKMQRRLAKSQFNKELCRQLAIVSGCPGLYRPGFKRTMLKILKHIVSTWSESQIKIFLFQCLQAEDITPELQREILYILAGASTALTREQKKHLQKILNED